MTNVLTLRLDEGSQTFFEGMRRKHFPVERNLIPAHLSLFHTLPDSDDVYEALAKMAGRTEVFPFAVTGVRSLGKGVAYTVRSGELLRVHAELAEEFGGYLSAQDRQKFMPHVVVQNKATVEAARGLLAELEWGFHQLEGTGVGLDLWHYLGGPWELAETFLFGAA